MTNRIFHFISCIFIFLFLAGHVQGQEKRISVHAENTPLNQVLNQISVQYQLRFAFDDDLLSKYFVSFQLKDQPVDAFLGQLLQRYGLGSKLLGGTYVLVKEFDPPKQPVVARKKIQIPKVDSSKVVSIPPPGVIPNKGLAGSGKPLPSKIYSQISGYITDAGSGERLRYCQILLDGKKVLETNELGFYFSRITISKPLAISVLHLGYKRLDTIIEPNLNIRLDLALQSFSVFSEPVQVRKAEKYLIEIVADDNIIAFNPISTLKKPGLEPYDLINVLTLIPGIDFINGPHSGLSIRGGTPTENLVILDGIPVLETSHLFGNLSVLNSKFIQQAYVSKGNFGAEYGGRVSGIIEMTGKSGSGEKPSVDVTADLLHINGFVGIPLGDKISFSTAFRQSFVHLWPNYLFKKLALSNVDLETDRNSEIEGIVEIPIVNYRDINSKLSFSPDNHNEISLNYLNGFDSQEREFNFPTDGKYFTIQAAEAVTNGLSVKWGIQTAKHWKNTLSAGFNQLNRTSRIDYGKEANKNGKGTHLQVDYDHNNVMEFRTDWRSELKLNEFFHQFGGGYTQNELNYRFRHYQMKSQGKQNVLSDSITLDNRFQVANLFYQTHFQPWTPIRISAGVRGDYLQTIKHLSLMPRIGIEYLPRQSVVLSYHFGQYQQYLYRSFRIDTDHNFISTWALAENGKQVVRSNQHSLGLQYDRNSLMVNLEAYHKRSTGKTVYLGKDIDDMGLKYVIYEAVPADGLQQGIDLYCQYQQGIFHHLLSYSFSQARESIPEYNSNNYFSSANDQRHRLQLTEMVNYRNWVASASWNFATGSPVISEGSTSTQLLSDRLPNYSQVDMSLVRRITTKFVAIETGLTILNVLNRKNVTDINYFNLTGDSSELSVKSEISALSFTPLFFISLKY